jgi:leader peptidase (prepilin peptidase)/N-methyltransferase
MIPSWLGIGFSFVLGSIIGSFLNACIYRLPRGLSPGRPVRSFCPACEKPIRWFHNIPVLSYLALRGKCADCGKRISHRYPLVELLTALLFAALWVLHGLPHAPVYWLLTALLLVATFIDFDFLIIPDEITLGGVAAGLVCCLIFPSLMGTDSRWMALVWSFVGAASGYLLLWGVVELGKLAFGRKKFRLPATEDFVWKRLGETAEIALESDKITWEETFNRPTDELWLDCEQLEISGEALENIVIRFRYDFLFLPDGRSFDLDKLEEIRGQARAITIPREAMGFGDVKFIAAIGAFLGWQAVLFTIFISSIVGCVFGVIGLLLAGRQGGGQIPFGPFLALGALSWILGGSALWTWYFSLFPGGFLRF